MVPAPAGRSPASPLQLASRSVPVVSTHVGALSQVGPANPRGTGRPRTKSTRALRFLSATALRSPGNIRDQYQWLPRISLALLPGSTSSSGVLPRVSVGGSVPVVAAHRASSSGRDGRVVQPGRNQYQWLPRTLPPSFAKSGRELSNDHALWSGEINRISTSGCRACRLLRSAWPCDGATGTPPCHAFRRRAFASIPVVATHRGRPPCVVVSRLPREVNAPGERAADLRGARPRHHVVWCH